MNSNIDQAMEELIFETVKTSLEHILREYEETGELERSLKHEIIKLEWKLRKLDEAREIKLRSSMIKKEEWIDLK